MPEFQSSLQCLETLIGLASRDCPCNSAGRPETYDQSLSGLYLDDYEHGLSQVFAQSAKDCGDGDLWAVLQKARYEGINDFVTYLFRAIGQNLNSFVDGFSGEFGEVNKRAVNTGDTGCKKDITGFWIKPNVYNGASIKFKKVWLAISTAGTYEVKIHDMADLTTPVATVSIVHPGGYELVGFDVPVDDQVQPLSEAGKPISYSVSYERNGGIPLNYTYYCGCGDQYKPMWMKNQYMKSMGFCVDNLSELFPENTNCNRLNTGGLIVEWELICDPAEWLCKQDDSFWKLTQWGRVASKAAQLLCTQKVIAAILDTARINFYTMFSADALIEKKLAFARLTDELIAYLAENMPPHVNHCWSCKPQQNFSKRGIIV